ncbi:hypothetical protein FACS1894186_2340 [Alphaproteobacteria bacterium]|nr:hypothetical protein FACS1894186_2340 [Alphaproteobacteria bacterium]
MSKQGKDLDKIQAVLDILLAGEAVPAKYLDHPLRGRLAGYRDLHIEPDWVLVYFVSGDEVHLIATGSHAQVLGK